MIVSPEGHPSKLPPKAPFESQSGRPSRKPLRKNPLRSLSKPSRSPAEGLFSKTPPKPLPDRLSQSATCPGSQPEAISPKVPFDTPSNKTLRSLLRNAPRVPSAERNTSPPGFFPSCHVSPNALHREDFPRMSPEFAICL